MKYTYKAAGTIKGCIAITANLCSLMGIESDYASAVMAVSCLSEAHWSCRVTVGTPLPYVYDVAVAAMLSTNAHFLDQIQKQHPQQQHETTASTTAAVVTI